MKTDKFFLVEIVDRFSRLFMLLFAGIVLGCVLAVACYNATAPGICPTLTLLIIYCIVFSLYVYITGSIRKISKIEILKDRLGVIFEQKGKISMRHEVLFSDIKEFKITPGTDKKNLALENPEKDRFSLRIFGFRTTIETKDGEKIEFCDSKNDGVLIYSPSYIYRMIDLKRLVKDFPLVLENFDTRKDSEAFLDQFKYYEENKENIPLSKNKKYLAALIKYSVCFAIIAAVIASVIAYIMYLDVQNLDNVKTLFYITFGIILLVVLPTWLTAIFSVPEGSLANKIAREKIKEVIG